MREMPSKRRLDVHYIALQAGFWAMFAAICAYQTSLLLARGFTNTQIGVIVAIRCLAGVVAQPILGSFADKHPQIPLKVILCASLGVSLAAGLALFYPFGMAGTALIFLVLGALEISAYPLIDAMAIQFIQAGRPVCYSLGRGMGSMAYALCCVALGLLAGRFGVETTLSVHTGLTALLILLAATFPAYDRALAPARPGGEERPKSARALLRAHPRFTLMLAGIFLGITGVLPMSNFLINVIRARGGGEAQLGVALFLMAAFELPAALLFERLYRRYGAGRVLVCSMVFMGLKAGAFLLAGSVWALWAVQPLQMLGYGLFTPASVFYVSDSIDRADQVKGQTLMMAASNGLGGMMAGILGGRALDLWGVGGMLGLCMALCGGAAVLTALAVWGRRRGQ